MAQANDFTMEGTPEEIYEKHLVPAIFDYWTPKLIDVLSIQPGDRVLDLACGTGIVTRHAAPVVAPDGEVVGIDRNPSMLEVARSVISQHEKLVRFREGAAENLEFPDDFFAAVACQQSFQFFENRDRALQEAHRVLAPGGRLGLNVWREIERSPGYKSLRDALRKHAGDQAAAFIESPFALSDPDVLRACAEQAGFRDIRVREEVGPVRFPSLELLVEVECRAAASYFSDDVFSLSAELLEDLTSELEKELDQYDTKEGVKFPIETHVLTARK